MASSSEPPVLMTPAARRRSWFIKIVSIGLLLAVLHIPLAMTRGVLRERQAYKGQATEEIAGTWGGAQRVTGPVLAVPYSYRGTVSSTKVVDGRWTSVEEASLVSAVAYFLPDELTIDGDVDPEIRRRGIYKVVVYTARLKLAGALRADFKAAGIDAERIDWEHARLLFGVSDLRGLRSIDFRAGNGRSVAFEAGERGATAALPLVADPGLGAADGALDFTIDVVLQGSGSATFVPVGKKTTTAMRSSWRAPSFTGASLPVQRRVENTGFEAQWKVAHFNRGFPQSWTNRLVSDSDVVRRMENAAFGVRFAEGVDGYGMVERAQKYGVLFFVLVFAVYFLFEATADLRIHPLQYTMVGAALCLFFLGFLALTEFCAAAPAYAAAATACTAMVTLYSWSFLRTGWRTLVVFGGLAATYGYLYFVLQSEDYALLAGTAALFAMLALTMFCTRRINWYALDAPAAVKG